jgi:malonyl-CoA decarboxylase
MPDKPLSRLWDSIADRGREILAAQRGAQWWHSLENLCHDLLSERGEASGTALARELVERYEAMDEAQRLSFFTLLEQQFSPDIETIVTAAKAFRRTPGAESLRALSRAVEAPRQELIRRINLAPSGTAAIVSMRQSLLQLLEANPQLKSVEADFQHLLRSWFNRGFLELRRIDWSTPAITLEKLGEHEAVHEIRGWPDMRRRLERDRRCFAFFHPGLPEEPLIFVEVALVEGLADSIEVLLDRKGPKQDPYQANTAIFYSISNCQEGLRGISFGNFLIKQVVAELEAELPQLKTFATLSPIPGFRSWLARAAERVEDGIPLEELDQLDALKQRNWHRNAEAAEALREPLLALCAHYLLEEKQNGEPRDPVARFHLGNGASIERINWLADRSAKGLNRSAGMMVNYSYRPTQIEKNHEAYVHRGRIASSSSVRALARKR